MNLQRVRLCCEWFANEFMFNKSDNRQLQSNS